jgi:hypothetical protein
MLGLKRPWDVSGKISCSCDFMPPLPALLDVTPSGRCPHSIHPRPQPEVCISFKGLVVGGYSVSIGNAQVASLSSSRHRMEVVKKTKPPEIASLGLPLFRVVHERHHRKVQPVAACLKGTFYPNFKHRCRSSRRLEWCPPLLGRQCAQGLHIRLGSLLPHVGCSMCRE